MNPFHNPVFLTRMLKSYLVDMGRLSRWDETTLQRFQDRRIRHLAQFSQSVPLYQSLYQDANIDLSQIHGLHDLSRLPMVSKEDIKRFSPDGIISQHADRSQLVEVATSGTTGKSLTVYVDLSEIIIGLLGYLRMLQYYGVRWRQDRISIIGDFAPHTAESGYINRGINPRFNGGFLFKNIQWLDTNVPPEKVLDDLEAFKPDCIWGYVGMLGHLSLLKEQGKGQHVHPRVIAATGSVLDPALKHIIEQSFQTKVYEVYGATETGPIAFQCTEGGYHVLSDLLYLEVVRQGTPVPVGKAGNLVVTKLYGGGTPIIRYNAVNDIISLRQAPCRCGQVGQLIERIYGRDDLSLILPGGRILLPASFAEIYSKLLYELRTRKLRNTKVIQHDLTSVEVLVELDASIASPTDEEVCQFLQAQFANKLGPGITVKVRPVEQIEKGSPRIVSHVDHASMVLSDYI
jgi:phenylacetate-CoA ligase